MLGRVQSGGGVLGRHALAALGDLDSSSSTMFDQPLAAITSRWRQEFLFHGFVFWCGQGLAAAWKRTVAVVVTVAVAVAVAVAVCSM